MTPPWSAKIAGLPKPLFRSARSVYRMYKKCRRAIRWALSRDNVVADLEPYERSWYSQNGEDGILQLIFHKIGTKSRFCVEFGVENGYQCNTRRLIERCGWTGLLMDGAEYREYRLPVRREYITAENVNAVFAKHAVPSEFDLLSIDVDGNDYWIWRAIEGYSPRVVVIEYNASVPLSESRTIPYDPQFRWDGTNYFGASLLALQRLGRAKGYTLIGCDSHGVNAFFVRDDELQGRFLVRPIESAYAPPRYGQIVDGRFIGHRRSDRFSSMVEVGS